MKKFTYKAFILSLAIGTLYSCSDEFTDLNNEYNSTYTNYYKSEEEINKAVNAIYDYMDDEDMFGRGYFWFIHASDDMVTGRPNGKGENIKNFNLDGGTSYLKWMYPQSYIVIRRCNDVIVHLVGNDDIKPNTSIRKEVADQAIGEAKFMRAFHYFWLAHSYGDNGKNGGVPIVTEKNMELPVGQYKRPKSVVENYAQIIEDLEEAAEKLPYFTDYTPDMYGRPHKDAAWAYIAKTYLYWAQYDASKYDKVIEYCDKVINSKSNRHLVNTGNPAKDYRELHSHLQNWGSEYIWSVNSGVNGGSKLPGIALERSGWGKYNGWGYFMPTKELYDAYSDDDVRRGVTILAWGDKFRYFGEERTYESGNSTSGYQLNKYMYEYQFPNPEGTYINANGDDGSTLYNVPLLRFAEILLMKAEAKLMKGQNADQEINLVRERAGVKPLNGATLEDLKKERRLELAGEFANRHFDLVRWGDAQKVYAKPLHGNPKSGTVNGGGANPEGIIWKGRNFDPSYMHVWPIPNEVVTDSGIPQNIGW